MHQNANLESLVYASLCCRTPTCSQLVQSVCSAHLITGESLAYGGHVLQKIHCRELGMALTCHKTWSHRHLQHLFYISNITLIP